MLVREELITTSQLHNALELQRGLKDEDWTPLGHILVAHGLVTRAQLIGVLLRHRKRLSLGEIFVKMGTLSQDQLDSALEERGRTGRRLGETLLELEYADEETIRRALCLQLHIKFVDLDGMALDMSLASLVNETYSEKHLVVPIARKGDVLVVVMDDPTNDGVIHDMQTCTGLTIEVTTSMTASVRRAHKRLYGPPSTFAAEDNNEVTLGDPTAKALYERLTTIQTAEPLSMRGGIADASLTTGSTGAERIVRDLLNAASEAGASDIHLESVDGRMVVRFRVDGILQSPDNSTLESAVARNRNEVVSRIKIMSQLDIAERRRPQDGGFRVVIERDAREIKLDFRVFGHSQSLRRERRAADARSPQHARID